MNEKETLMPLKVEKQSVNKKESNRPHILFSNKLVFTETKKKKKKRMGMVVHSCNPALRRLRQEVQEFKVSMGNIARPLLKKKKRKEKRKTL
jgi:hypothetical protein